MYTKLLLSAALGLGAMHTHAAVFNVTQMSFDRGTLLISGLLPEPMAMAGSDQSLVGAYNAFPNQLTLASFPMSFYTSDGTTAPFGGTPTGGGPAPSATVDTVAGTINIDLSSWTGHFEGTNFAQGAADVSGTWDPFTGAYEISWSAIILGTVGGPHYGHYALYGIAAVPEAKTHALMLAGLALVGAAVRRKARQALPGPTL